MRKQIIILFSIFFALNLTAQKKQISHSDIWESMLFYPKTIDGINSMNNGIHYTVLHRKGIVEYDYETGEEIKTILPTNPESHFSDYSFSKKEDLILLEQDVEEIYRYSKKAIYTVYDRESQSFISIFEGKKIQEPTFSPDGNKVAFVFENNIYYQDLKKNKVIQVTQDGMKNRIINGITDWVYEEEFAFVRAFEWNYDGNTIAYIRFDETNVKEVNLSLYGLGNYPELMTFKYPKAGEENAKVSVHYYNLKTQKTSTLDLTDYRDFYVPKIQFNQVGEKNVDDLFVFVSNRHQNKLDVLKVDVKKNTKKVLFKEKDQAWITTDNLTFILIPSPGNVATQFILWTSERDGFNHVYLLDYHTGEVEKQITQGNWEVTKVYGCNPDIYVLYYQSTEEGSINRSIYSKSIFHNKKQKLSSKTGWNDAAFSRNYQYFINTYTNANTPHYITLNNGENGETIKILEDNKKTQEIISHFDLAPKEFTTITTPNGDELNAWIIKPTNFKKEEKYPVLMYAYGGPGSQTVVNSWGWNNYFWFQQLAQQGYIVVSVDNRGTGGKGRDFEKVIYKQLGKHEIEDQILVAKYLQKLPYVNEDRIGMFGWSFGGYMTSLALTKGADVFKMGIAVAPVTNWRFYDTVYTERFMQTPQENADGYDRNSPINHAEKLKGKYLLIHGSADDNVHYQNAMLMAEALVQANKEFDMHSYTNKNHGIYGGYTRLHLYRKMTRYIKENL